jgi:hypothetical protein
MSTGALVPVLNPDTGNVHGIPTDQVDAARQAGGKPVATMKDPQGQLRYVPMEQVGEAQKHGGTLIPYGSQSSTQAAQDITGIHPDSNPVTSGIEGIGRALKGVVTAPYEAAKSAFAPPTNAEEIAAEGAGGSVGLAADRMLVQPAEAAHKTAKGLWDTGHPIAAAGAELGAIPFLGPLGQSLGQRAASGDMTGAVTEGATNALLPKAMDAAVSKFPQRTGNVVVPGENYTPKQHASFSAVLARGSGAGKGYFPKDIATDIGSPTRQAAADNPQINPATANTPEESLARTQAVLGTVRNRIDAAHAQALGPVANTPVDPTPIQSAVKFPDSLKDFAEDDAKSVQGFKDRLGTVKTLGGLNDLRQYLNRELSSSFKKNSIAGGQSGAYESAMQSALKATRDLYYDQLEQKTGQNFQNLKRMESSVMSAEEGLGNAAPGMAARQAIAQQPRSIRGQAADVLQGAHTVGGSPVAGISKFAARKFLGETPMTPIHEGIQHFFKDLPQPSPPRVTGPAPAAAPAGPSISSPPLAPQVQSAAPATVTPSGNPEASPPPAPNGLTTTRPPVVGEVLPPARTLDRAAAKEIYDRAGRDPEKARELARKEGYQF